MEHINFLVVELMFIKHKKVMFERYFVRFDHNQKKIKC